MVVLYHYTNEQGANGISETGIIRMSERQNRDAFFGNGVYFTMLPPHISKQIIVQNNWDGRLPLRIVERYIRQGKIDFVITVHIPDDDPRLKQCDDREGRDIVVYLDDVDLRRFRHSIERF
jgi:hypothetical protein